jgi:hypothetical protein
MRSVLGFTLCALWVALGLISLGIGLSGMMVMDPPGGLFRILSGFIGFFVVFGLTLLGMSRS